MVTLESKTTVSGWTLNRILGFDKILSRKYIDSESANNIDNVI
jgi:hypothetical protein